MNTKLFATAAAATTATVLLGFAGAAQAFSFGTGGIKFDSNTDVKFNFVQANGWFKSTLSVYEVIQNAPGSYSLGPKVADLFRERSNVNPGSGAHNGYYSSHVSQGGVVETVQSTVTFLAGKIYTLALSSVTPKGHSMGTVFSMNALNLGGDQRAVFEAPHSTAINGNDGVALPDRGNYSSADPFQPPVAPGQIFKPVTIGFEDTVGGGDRDYNDFIVTAEAPEPLTISGLALGGAGLLAARRRRQSKQA